MSDYLFTGFTATPYRRYKSKREFDKTFGIDYVLGEMHPEEYPDSALADNDKEGERADTRVDNYKSMFKQGAKKIFIQGDAGTGKSTLSKAITIDWCTSVDNYPPETLMPSGIVFDDLKALQQFEFIFLISTLIYKN